MPHYLPDGRYVNIPEFWRDPIHCATCIQPDENASSHRLTAGKARLMLHEGTVHGHPITDKQRRFFGAIAGGAKIRKKGY